MDPRALLFVCASVVAAAATGSTSCEAPNVHKGQPTKVTCYFSFDISKTKDEITVLKYDNDWNDTTVLIYAWPGPEGKVVYRDQNYSFDGHNISSTLVVVIPSVSEQHVGRYECQTTSSDNFTRCSLEIIPEAANDSGLEETTGQNQKNGSNEIQREESVGAKIIALAVGIVVAVALVVIFLILAICFLKRRRRTLPKMDDVTENQADDTGFSLLRDKGDGAEMIPMKETVGETERKLRHTDSDEDETTSLLSWDIHTTLFEACKTGDVKKLKYTCPFLPNSLIIANNNGDTLIHVASRYDQAGVVSQLLLYGALTCATNKQGRTPLHMASYYGAISVIDVLLKDKAKTDAQDNNGSTPLHLACEKKENEDTSKPSKSKKKSGAEVASDEKINTRQVDVVKKLLGAGADVCVVDAKGQTPLHLACLAGSKEIVQILIDYGADVTVTDENVQTPALLAKKNGHKDIAEQISEHMKGMKKQAKKKMKLTEKDLC